MVSRFGLRLLEAQKSAPQTEKGRRKTGREAVDVCVDMFCSRLSTMSRGTQNHAQVWRQHVRQVMSKSFEVKSHTSVIRVEMDEACLLYRNTRLDIEQSKV